MTRSLPKVTALTSSGYIDVCSLSDIDIRLLYVNGKFVKVKNSEQENSSSNYDHDDDTVGNRHLVENHHLYKPQPNEFSFSGDVRKLNGYENEPNNGNDKFEIGRECRCGSINRNEMTLCLIRNDENHCRVPTSKEDPIECFHSSMFQVLIKNLWPFALLWIMALTFYLFTTDAGRSTLQFVCSTACCCFRDRFNSSNLIESIIIREASMRNLYQIASLTRDQEDAARTSTVVTYILKTREYFNGSSSKNKDMDFEMTKKCSLVDDDVCQSPSDETLMTSPGSFASSPTFEINDEENNDNTPNDREFLSPNKNEEQEMRESYDEENDDPICSICMLDIEDGNRVGVLSCNHLFHADCLKEWIKRKNACPLCQTPIAEEKNNTDGSNEAPRINYPTTFTVRTTGSPIESERRRPRIRRTRPRAADVTDNNTTRRQLFVTNGNGRIPPTVTSSAGVTLISARAGNHQQRRILVGDPARASSSNAQREQFVHGQRRPMRITALQYRHN